MSDAGREEEERFNEALESYVVNEPLPPEIKDLPVQPHLILCGMLLGYLALNVTAFFYFRHDDFRFGRLQEEYVPVCFIGIPVIGAIFWIILLKKLVWGAVGFVGFPLGAIGISLFHFYFLIMIGLEPAIKKEDRQPIRIEPVYGATLLRQEAGTNQP
jgi:hypothetical protein